jgi:DNA polymerase-1
VPSNEALNETLGAWLTDATCQKAIYGAKDVTKSLLDFGVKIDGVNYDALLLAYLLNPIRRGFEIDDVALEHLGLSVTRSDPNQLVAEETTDASLNAWLGLVIAERLYPQVEEEEQLRVYGEVELPTNAALARMEHFSSGCLPRLPRLPRRHMQSSVEKSTLPPQSNCRPCCSMNWA